MTAYRDDAETLKREVDRLRNEVAALRSQRWQRLAEWARKKLRAVVVIAGCSVFVALLAAWFGTCSNGPCKAVARREALDFVERTTGVTRDTLTVYCAHTCDGGYRCFVTRRGAPIVELDCTVNATWDVGGCRPHGE